MSHLQYFFLQGQRLEMHFDLVGQLQHLSMAVFGCGGSFFVFGIADGFFFGSLLLWLFFTAAAGFKEIDTLPFGANSKRLELFLGLRLLFVFSFKASVS